MSEDNKHTKHHETVPSKPLVDYMEENKLTTNAMGKIIGKTQSCVAKWANEGKMPMLALLALEGLQRRRRNPWKSLLLITPPDIKTADTITRVANGLGAKVQNIELP